MKIIFIILFTASVLFGENAPTTKPSSNEEITIEQKIAVAKGLEWLADNQKDDGGWTGQYANDNAPSHIGISALAGLALMQSGSLPFRGKYGKEVQHCLDFILANCQESGLISNGESQPMYSHFFSCLFLSEIYGMTGNEEIKEKLTKAVHLIERIQNDEGAWRYYATKFDSDISVTVAAIMALRDARNVGIKVEKETIDKAIKYVLACQNLNTDGGFVYQKDQIGSGSGYARSGAGITAIFHCGISQGKEIDKGIAYLMRFIPGGKEPTTEGQFYYGAYYTSQAMFLHGGEEWKTFYPAIRNEIIAKQDQDGHFTGAEAGDVEGTAFALLVLQLTNKNLPIYAGVGND